MFPESIKRAAAFTSSYRRGQDLCRRGRVLDWTGSYPENDDVCQLEGRVSGSAGAVYDVYVALDMGDQVPVDYSCTCPAHANYAGMCKHAVALALRYLEEHPEETAAAPSAVPAPSQPTSADAQSAPRTREQLMEYYDISDGLMSSLEGIAERLGEDIESVLARYAKLLAPDAGAGGASGGGGKRKTKKSSGSTKKKQQKQLASQPTHKKMAQLLNAQAALAQFEARSAQEASQAQAEEAAAPVEPVTFECTVAKVDDPYSYRYYGETTDAYELRLRVRRGKVAYVVKCITDLVAAWEDESLLEYGKNLAFVHAHDAFDDNANTLMEFIARIEHAQRALLLQQYHSWYGNSAYVKKALPLTSQDVVQVLDILQGQDVSFEVSVRRNKSTTVCKVVAGDPDLCPRLDASEDGGWDLMLPAKLDYIRSVDDLYVLDFANKRAWRCSREFGRRLGPFCETLMPTDGKAFHICAADVPVFCERVLPLLETQQSFTTPDELADFAPPEAEFSFRIGLLDGNVTCSALVAYDENVISLFDDLEAGHPVRDIARELEAQRVVRTYFPNGFVLTPSYTLKEGSGTSSVGTGYYASHYVPPRKSAGYGPGPGVPWFPEEEVDLLYRLLAEGLQELSLLGEVLVSERLRGVNVREAPEVRVDANVSGGLLDLRVDASGLTPADLMSYLSSYRRKQRYVRLTSGDIVRLGDGVQALSSLADGLGVDPEQLIGEDGEGAQLPANRTLFVDALLKEAPGVRLNRDEGFRAIVRAFDTVADSDFVEPDSLRDVLRSYQRTGFKWLATLDALGFGGILADDMGLGKTLQVIALLLACKEAADGALAAETDGEGAVAQGGAAQGGAAQGGAALLRAAGPAPALVVCPASLVYNWQAEIERFAPALDAVCVVGAAAARKRIVAAAGDHDVIITSYDLMKRDIDAYAKANFGIVVLDEAHYIKNSTTKVAKAAKRLPGRMRFALTGTPIENRLAELWSIFDFLMPGILGSRESFSRRFEKPILAGEEGAAARLQSLVSPFILRRLKGDVLSDLPEKNESIVYAVMEGEQDKLYKANSDKLALMLSNQMPEEFAANKIAILAELTRLRQLCCDPHLVYENYTESSAKLDTCMDLVSSAVEGGHAVLLFSQFTSMLDIIAERMRAAKLPYLMLTGATSKEERVRLVREFQEGRAPVFLISLKAGGVGLNLTAADIVIHYDPWWNLSAQNQATDRAHRIGQTRDVSVFKIIAKDTIEEKIVEMQEAKRDLAESVIGGAGVSSAALTREDVLALLGAQG